MKLTLSTRPVLPRAPDNGAHRLAWAAIADMVFADAYHAGVGELVAHLPMPEMEDAFALRAELTCPKGNRSALISSGLYDVADYEFSRVYTIEHGGVVRGRIRAHASVMQHQWVARHQIWVYTLRSRLFGIPIRLALLAGRPRFADQMSFQSRRAFVSRRPALAYYHVTVWEAKIG